MQQLELFGKDQFAVALCPRCKSVGTIVDMGSCCRIAALKNSALTGQGVVLSETTRNETTRKRA